MLMNEELRARLAHLQSTCQPTTFSGLLTFVDEFLELISLSYDVPDLSQCYPAFRRTLLVLFASVNESYSKGLLQLDTSISDPSFLELQRGLPTSEWRFDFLGGVLNSSLASVCLHFMNIHEQKQWDEEVLEACGHLLGAVREVPALAPLASQIDWAKYTNLQRQVVKEMVSTCRDNRFILVDVEGAISRAGTLAWSTLLQVPSLSAETERLSLLKSGAEQIKVILDFLLLSEGRHWKLGEFYELQGDSSLTQILRELHRYQLELIDEQHVFAPLVEDQPWKKIYCLRRSFLEKKDYLIVPPGFQYFVDSLTLEALLEWESDCWKFIGERITQISASESVRSLQSDLKLVRESILASQVQGIQGWLMRTAGEMSSEFLATGVVESLHLPPLCTPFLTAIFHRLFRTLHRH